MKGESAMKRIRDKLKIVIDYTPNDDGDDWELRVNVNGDGLGVVPFGCSSPDLTLNQILKGTKEILEEVLNL